MKEEEEGEIIHTTQSEKHWGDQNGRGIVVSSRHISRSLDIRSSRVLNS
jgi:hypothetical protein